MHLGGNYATTIRPVRNKAMRGPLALLRAQRDERLVARLRAGEEGAFDALFDRYRARLLAFCRGMLRSSEDAEDVLQEVFAAAHAAMLADDRPIEVRPWLYRIARNRCLNHLRRPIAKSSDALDAHPHDDGISTEERAAGREELRALVSNIRELPEAQRSALLLREFEALPYEQIARTMETSVSAVKSLLVRARMSLAEASQAQELTCADVHVELAATAEGLRRVSGQIRHHLRGCAECREYRAHLRASSRGLGALAPMGPILWLKEALGLGGHGGLGFAGSKAAAGAALAVLVGTGGLPGNPLPTPPSPAAIAGAATGAGETSSALQAASPAAAVPIPAAAGDRRAQAALGDETRDGGDERTADGAITASAIAEVGEAPSEPPAEGERRTGDDPSGSGGENTIRRSEPVRELASPQRAPDSDERAAEGDPPPPATTPESSSDSEPSPLNR
jgi:RNA polymerase sigma factor (sigma-70 family)